MAQPIIIVGAGRSGTNMLRDLLVSQEGWVTWPCDEINYIWRHKNRGYPTDEFDRDMASVEVKTYIRSQFDKLLKSSNGSTVVEKTCANVLRAGFVDEVLPNAKFIHLVRDGRDVALSALERWKAPLDIPYLLAKARYIPSGDIAYYAQRYLKNRINKARSKEGILKVWGPKFEGMEEIFSSYHPLIACAVQWDACVNSASQQLKTLEQNRTITIRYEDLADNDSTTIRKLLDFLEISGERAERMKDLAIASISNRSVGKWKKKMTSDQLKEMLDLVGDRLIEFDYEV